MFRWLYGKYEYEFGAGGTLRTRVDGRKKVSSNGQDQQVNNGTDAARSQHPRGSRQADSISAQREGSRTAAQVVYQRVKATRMRQNDITRGLDSPTLVAAESSSKYEPRQPAEVKYSLTQCLTQKPQPRLYTRAQMQASSETRHPRVLE